MMTEIYWKVFLASIATVIVAKVFGCTLGTFSLFALSFVGWLVGLLILMTVGDAIWEKCKKSDSQDDDNAGEDNKKQGDAQ